MSAKPPWQTGPLSEWAICGMNHYHVAGERFLFVSMVRDGSCITEEGKDDEFLWNRLCHKAWAIEDAPKAGTVTPREKTLASIRDGFGGDTYRRRAVDSNSYTCGCRWERRPGIGDVLVECSIHHAHHSRGKDEWSLTLYDDSRRVT